MQLRFRAALAMRAALWPIFVLVTDVADRLLLRARWHAITASQNPMGEYDLQRGDCIGHRW